MNTVSYIVLVMRKKVTTLLKQPFADGSIVPGRYIDLPM
jgi:hypothetical protein